MLNTLNYTSSIELSLKVLHLQHLEVEQLLDSQPWELGIRGRRIRLLCSPLALSYFN